MTDKDSVYDYAKAGMLEEIRSYNGRCDFNTPDDTVYYYLLNV